MIGTDPSVMKLPFPAAYIVCYDFYAPNGFDHSPFIQELQKSSNWWHYLKNTWIVLRNDTLVDFTNALLATIHKDDRLLVLPAKGPGSGWLPPEAWHWINQSLKSEW